MNIEKIQSEITKLFLEVYNKPINHNSAKAHFPCESLPVVCEAIGSIGELAENRHIQSEVKVGNGLCTVSFTWFDTIIKPSGVERKVRAEFCDE